MTDTEYKQISTRYSQENQRTTPHRIPDRPGSWQDPIANYIIGLDVFRQFVDLVRPLGIPVMPLKGILLQATVYRPPWIRTMTDIDVLIPKGYVAEVASRLRQQGWIFILSQRGGAYLQAPIANVGIDLHEHLFPPHMFRLDTSAVFARSTLDSELFGCPVQIADPYDTFAHLVGHFAKDRLTSKERTKLKDLHLVQQRFRLDSKSCAHHLVKNGLGRASQYSLGIAASQGDGFAKLVLAELEPDPVGSLLAAAARWYIEYRPLGYRSGAVCAHLLNYNLSAATLAVGANIGLVLRRHFYSRWQP